MDDLMHSSAALFIYNLITFIFWKVIPPGQLQLLCIIFGLLPDFDGIIWKIKQKGKTAGMEFQHHMDSPFHWPVFWLPTLLFPILGIIFRGQMYIYILPALGVYTHMLCDSAACGDGMMWCHGIRKDSFGRYINLFSDRTDGYHGNYWFARYKKTVFFKIGVVSAIAWIIFFIIQYVGSGLSDHYLILCVLYFTFSIIIALKRDTSAYEKEPPEGRYADYRKNRKYLEWMKRKGYIFNEKYRPVREKKVKRRKDKVRL